MKSKSEFDVKRGMILLANLKGLLTSKYGTLKPVLVIQNDKGNKHSPCTIVVVSNGEKIREDFVWDFDLVFTIDKKRLQSFIGYILSDELWKIQDTLNQSLISVKQS
ncbi:type II toxin-antitoxin system PemK/MazF family toxin [Piscibacillus salipiscarius]|uniref:type II toxin-antitoxin system PemK/MazF family toxin n=1 Tax=Piscibacillus salipiscarius TaxID=299480 RepID=UPI0006CFA3E7|nr:type II toxin-antitoxin system PemK/MazF family toxin [Piscibacillus salipiscarius]